MSGSLANLTYAVIAVTWLAALAHSIIINRRERSVVVEGQLA